VTEESENTGSIDEEIRQQVIELANQFQIFQCEPCASEIKCLLISRGIRGKHIKLYTGSSEDPYGNIYHEILQNNIATNGRHEAISLEIEGQEIVFDNLHPGGIDRISWMNNLYCPIKDTGGDFQVTEMDF
jgi:hypothetical protein